LSVPTAHRLVGSMMAHGLLSRDHDGRLQLGPRFAVPYLAQVAGPVLADLQQQTGETAQIWAVRRTRTSLITGSNGPFTRKVRANVPLTPLTPSLRGSRGPWK
jgi:DNA-binding IclR family transcriptional regulator